MNPAVSVMPLPSGLGRLGMLPVGTGGSGCMWGYRALLGSKEGRKARHIVKTFVVDSVPLSTRLIS